MSRILIFGQNGQLARALARSLDARGRDYRAIGSQNIDLRFAPEATEGIILNGQYSAVINASGWTDVNRAETNAELATLVNAYAPAYMARACARKDIPFVHISTDYVFDGKAAQPYKPNAEVNPLNVYGHSKMQGENQIMSFGGRSAILRTSWLFDGTGTNFLTKILSRINSGQALQIVDDQIGRPTYAGHLAEACLSVIERPPQSPTIHHVQNSGKPITWYEFAKIICRHAGFDAVIEPVQTQIYEGQAERPAYSVLDISAFETECRHHLLPWTVGLDFALKEYQAWHRRS